MAVDTVVDLIDQPLVTSDPRMHPVTLARFFRVLSDPTRLRLLQLLDERSRTAGELVTALEASQPRVSTHLACLRHCGFVIGDRRGREVVYRLQLPDVPRLLALAEVAARPRAEHLSQCTRIAPDWA